MVLGAGNVAFSLGRIFWSDRTKPLDALSGTLLSAHPRAVEERWCSSQSSNSSIACTPTFVAHSCILPTLAAPCCGTNCTSAATQPAPAAAGAPTADGGGAEAAVGVGAGAVLGGLVLGGIVLGGIGGGGAVATPAAPPPMPPAAPPPMPPAAAPASSRIR